MARRLIRVVGGALAFITAIVAIPALSTSARDVVFPNEEAYDKLSRLAAGLSIETFNELLGAPSTVFIDKSGDVYDYFELTNGAFGGAAYRVRAITPHGDKSTSLFSVSSCDPQFTPTFHAPFGAEVTLQRPIARAATAHRDVATRGRAQVEPDALGANTAYLTGSSTAIYGEASGEGATADSFSSFAYGADELCDPIEDSLGHSLPAYWGPLDGAPRAVRVFREQTRATFYAETFTGPALSIDSLPGAVEQYMGVPYRYR